MSGEISYLRTLPDGGRRRCGRCSRPLESLPLGVPECPIHGRRHSLPSTEDNPGIRTDGGVDEGGSELGPLDVTCPRCGFKSGSECHRLVAEGATSKTVEPHPERVQLAEDYSTDSSRKGGFREVDAR